MEVALLPSQIHVLGQHPLDSPKQLRRRGCHLLDLKLQHRPSSSPASRTVPLIPPMDWKKTLAEVKREFAARRFQTCLALCKTALECAGNDVSLQTTPCGFLSLLQERVLNKQSEQCRAGIHHLPQLLCRHRSRRAGASTASHRRATPRQAAPTGQGALSKCLQARRSRRGSHGPPRAPPFAQYPKPAFPRWLNQLSLLRLYQGLVPRVVHVLASEATPQTQEERLLL